MDIYIIRHGETDFNVGEVRFRGQIDVHLSELGVNHALETGKALVDTPIDTIYYSKLSRAKVTAEKIKEHQPKANLTEEPYLFDMSFGDWQGQSLKEVFTFEEEKQWLKDPNDFIIPNGETFYQVLDRIHRLFKRLQKQEEKNIVLVSHGAVINLIFVYLTRTDPSQFYSFYVKPCSITHISLKPDGTYKLIGFNEIKHLS
ncbi:MAG: histidine phosphatase family protein [Candidatus Heimdallarchaeota archaeon]|nr:histidine phosphatase family protein [Candidatus Heimdallarchaeota archaeon]